MTRKEYIKMRIHFYQLACQKQNQPINILILRNLIKQWKFDWEMKK